MRGWVRTGFILGGVLVVTWSFGVIGYHTPYTFAMSVVGTTGLALVAGCGLHACERR